ncbi:EAL domain-containing protein [Larsenimonas salina]|uniref:EAL domain-containing protein n=1 Tax=Larsenimonas salina TaxID=1295565 RepID=UPI002074946C|nr:EAL domain-containing protein [Larsenimonas salina]MCM5705343.1 EAL domain-containing protein [Larsenimonas salina]
MGETRADRALTRSDKGRREVEQSLDTLSDRLETALCETDRGELRDRIDMPRVERLSALCAVLLDRIEGAGACSTSAHTGLDGLLRRAIEARDSYARKLHLILSGSRDGVFEWALDEDRIHLSPRWFNTLGLAPLTDPQPPTVWLSRIHADDRGPFRRAIDDHLADRTPTLDLEYRILDGAGHWRVMHCRGIKDAMTGEAPTWLIGTHTDVTHRHYTDPATGLGNGELLDQLLDDACRASDDARFCLVSIGLSNVCSVMESSLPHYVNGLLKYLGDELAEVLPDNTPLILLPEHTFAVVLKASDSSELEASLVEIEGVLSRPKPFKNKRVWLSYAMGTAAFSPTQGLLSSSIRARARLATQYAARRGVGFRCQYSDALELSERQASTGEQLIRQALDDDGVRCLFQPIVSLREEGRITAFEGLMRLQTADGLVPPACFMDVAEQSALIHELSRRMIDRALSLMTEEAFEARYGTEFTLNVNLSRQQLQDDTLVTWLSDRLDRYGVAPSRFQVEVTESTVLASLAHAQTTLNALRDMGIRVALDDFGSGYSSLSQLSELPLDTIKFDKCLIQDIKSLPRKRHVLASVSELCFRLGYDVVVEGVEDLETLAIVRGLGVDTIQGFVYCEPRSAEDLLAQVGRFPVPARYTPSSA